MNTNKLILGHLAAFITIMIWGTTFISTKILLDYFTPLEILFFVFLLGSLHFALSTHPNFDWLIKSKNGTLLELVYAE